MCSRLPALVTQAKFLSNKPPCAVWCCTLLFHLTSPQLQMLQRAAKSHSPAQCSHANRCAPNVQTFQALAGISAQEAPASRLVGIGTRCRRLKNCGPPTHQRRNTLTHTPITPSRAPLQGCDLGYAGRCVCLKMRHLVAGWQHPRCLL